ncbi:MAG TPA: lantibiotic dehydratase C-terminal domain-containing protein [Longimicrobium sp.]|nr:lantibiotic dehydratase C-terminal domain-containing protein [Longimicrobium sp.]
MSAPLPSAADGWQGFHLVYHADRERLLRQAVQPLAAGLLRDGLATRFFVIRYLLGGPHLRLRVQCDPADAPAVAARVHEAAAAFFAAVPSLDPLPDEEVHRQNRGVIASDPFADASDDVVWADNSVVSCPVHFEVDRYGGPDRWARSVDLFGLSTVGVLQWLETHAGAPEGRRTAERARLLLRQARGHAADGKDFAMLVDFGEQMFGKPLAKLLPVADAAFEQGRTGLVALVRAELARTDRPGMLAEGARALAGHLRGMDDEPRRFVGISHLHMTANRLGMRNPDEVYLCRMLSRAVEVVRTEHPEEWCAAWEAHAQWMRTPSAGLDEQLRAALDEFSGRGTLGPPFARIATGIHWMEPGSHTPVETIS